MEAPEPDAGKTRPDGKTGRKSIQKEIWQFQQINKQNMIVTAAFFATVKRANRFIIIINNNKIFI